MASLVAFAQEQADREEREIALAEALGPDARVLSIAREIVAMCETHDVDVAEIEFAEITLQTYAGRHIIRQLDDPDAVRLAKEIAGVDLGEGRVGSWAGELIAYARAELARGEQRLERAG